jgi:hypothetical protein
MSTVPLLTALQISPGGPASIHAAHCPAVYQQGRRFDLDATTIDKTIDEVWSDELDNGDVELDEATRNTTFHTCTGLAIVHTGPKAWCQHEHDDLSLCGSEALPGRTRCAAHQGDG